MIVDSANVMIMADQEAIPSRSAGLTRSAASIRLTRQQWGRSGGRTRSRGVVRSHERVDDRRGHRPLDVEGALDVGYRYASPPNWPAPPPGWVPQPDWRPQVEWGPAPPGWQFWVDDGVHPATPTGAPQSMAPTVTADARIAQLKAELHRLGALDLAELDRRRQELANQIRQEHLQLDALKAQVAVTREDAILQEVGIYAYRHPLTDAAAYKVELVRLQDQIKSMATRDGEAIQASSTWTVNGSAAQGRTMIREYSKLMLRAYNAEADNLVRGLKPYKLTASLDRLNKVALTIERLGETMSIRISGPYHYLRVRELELTADFLEKQAEEKEREREEKARLREERKAQLEMQRERERLDRERQHHLNALAAVEAAGEGEAAERLRAQLADVDRAIADVDYRAANVRAGYVYVISNVGSFGPDVIKVGMTRRLEPRDRIRELSDASVPFNFDVHALFFSADAYGIEAKMHQLLADRRVNRINARREFFYATPVEAHEKLKALAGEILEFAETPEAVEYHQSETERTRGSDARPSKPSPPVAPAPVAPPDGEMKPDPPV